MSSQKLYLIFVLVIFSAFVGGAYLLESIGIKYTSPGGSPIVKIHIFAYIAIGMFANTIINSDISSLVSRMRGFSVYWLVSFFSINFATLCALYRFGTSGIAYLVVTILAALVLIPYVYRLDDRHKLQLLKFSSLLLLCNSCIAIIEFALQKTIIPVEFTVFSYFRSTALLANPLNNSLITATLALLLIRYTTMPKVVYFSITVLALFSFGGRAGVAIFLLMTFLGTIGTIRQFISGGVAISKLRFAVLQILFVVVLSFLFYLVVQTNISDRISNKMFFDSSAQARFDIMLLLEQLSLYEWFFGATTDLKNNISFYLGIDIIENYFVAWVMDFGLFGAVPILISIFTPLIYFFINGDKTTRITIFIFMFISFSNNALATKTPVLVFLYTLIVCHSQLCQTKRNSSSV